MAQGQLALAALDIGFEQLVQRRALLAQAHGGVAALVVAVDRLGERTAGLARKGRTAEERPGGEFHGGARVVQQELRRFRLQHAP